MGQLVIPRNRSLKGPWLIDRNSLEELNEVLINIKEIIDDSLIHLIEKEAKEKLPDLKKWDEEADMEKAIKEVKNSYPYSDSEEFVLLTSKDGKKIVDNSLLDLLKDPKLDTFKPTKLEIKIKKGPNEISIEIPSRFEDDLDLRIISPEDVVFSNVSFEIEKWVENHKPNIAVQKWSNWFPWAIFPILMILLILTPIFLETRSDIYKDELKKEAIETLEDGINENNIENSLELILKMQSGYVPDDFNPEIKINKTLGNIWILTILITVILSIRPKTVIGLGKNRMKISFYRKWIYFVLVFVPLSIVFPIVRSKILN